MSNKHPVPVISCVVGVYWFVRTPKTDASVAATAYKLLAVGGFLVNTGGGGNRCRDWGGGAWYGWVERGDGGRKVSYRGGMCVLDLTKLHYIIVRGE